MDFAVFGKLCWQARLPRRLPETGMSEACRIPIMRCLDTHERKNSDAYVMRVAGKTWMKDGFPQALKGHVRKSPNVRLLADEFSVYYEVRGYMGNLLEQLTWRGSSAA